MAKKNNKTNIQPEVEKPVEEVVENEAIVIDPEVLQTEAPEISTEVEPLVDTVVETEADTVVDTEVKPEKFEFKDEYSFGPGNGDAIIDTLPEEKTREEKIAEIVEKEAEVFDAEEEKFLNKTVAEIEESPVCEDDGKCDGECPDKDCPCNNEVSPEEYFKSNPEISEEKVMVLYAGKAIKFPKGKDVADYSRAEMSVFVNTGKLPR